jgi:thymidylate synthase
MRLLAIINSEYGQRHVDNILAHRPEGWELEIWQAPRVLPQVIDYPEDYLPAELPAADLILSFAEHKGVAELLPEVAGMTGARAVIAAIDNEACLPRGLARQLRGWLAGMGVACATPKPLCSLTEHDFGVTLKERMSYDSPEISEFAGYFGQPRLAITVDPDSRTIAAAEVVRDAVCGCTRHVAERIIGMSVDEVVEQAGLLHHHFPCLASMQKDHDFNMDTLMHASGHILQEDIRAQVKPFQEINYLRPGNLSEAFRSSEAEGTDPAGDG